tara:strand:+ start:617 stop:790 length:174 start_codon:yes stop_codon:yes gene_type:complete
MITSAKYQKNLNDSSVNEAIVIVIDGETMTVPITEDNRHYQMIQEWVAEGNTIEEGE